MNQEEYMEQLKMAGEFHGEICGIFYKVVHIPEKHKNT